MRSGGRGAQLIKRPNTPYKRLALRAGCMSELLVL